MNENASHKIYHAILIGIEKEYEVEDCSIFMDNILINVEEEGEVLFIVPLEENNPLIVLATDTRVGLPACNTMI